MPIEINGLALPVALTAALESGQWRAPSKPEAWRPLFPHEQVSHALLYELELMKSENANWLLLGSKYPSYLGRSDASRPPGDIDATKSLLIADLGPDKMIALDYRESSSHPSVVYLADEPEGSQWIRVAPDVDTFMRELGIGVRGREVG